MDEDTGDNSAVTSPSACIISKEPGEYIVRSCAERMIRSEVDSGVTPT
jgi:hypothetical protein